MIQNTRAILLGMKVLIGNSDKKWQSNMSVVVENGLIKAIVPTEMIGHHLPAKKHSFPADSFLVPGLIDLHIHGTHGFDVMDANPDSLVSMARALAVEGVTGFLPTTMTAPTGQLETVLKTIPIAARDTEGAAILGVHLEGPFIANVMKGAQSENAIALPDAKLIEHWQHLAQDMIKIVTLAPEVHGAIEFIKTLRKMNLVISAGHTNATYEETEQAIMAGCTYATHLFNAMRGLHQREPGALGALLLSDKVTAELIVDGLHLHPAIVDMALRLKGKDRLILVTDAMRAKCMGDGQYDLGGQSVTVKAEKATLENGALAGSTLRLPQAIKNFMEFTGCLFEDAVEMATLNPARVLGLEYKKGSIEVGKDADLVVLSSSLNVMFTMREGRIIFEGPCI